MVYNGKLYEQMDDLGVPLVLETSIFDGMFIETTLQSMSSITKTLQQLFGNFCILHLNVVMN